MEQRKPDEKMRKRDHKDLARNARNPLTHIHTPEILTIVLRQRSMSDDADRSDVVRSGAGPRHPSNGVEKVANAEKSV